MTRFFSFLAAIIVFASASAEIASFVIDHKSWLQENYKAARDYVTIPAPARPDQPTPPQQPCAANCTPTAAVPPQKDDAHRCDGIDASRQEDPLSHHAAQGRYCLPQRLRAEEQARIAG
jgi:hypothetical protein